MLHIVELPDIFSEHYEEKHVVTWNFPFQVSFLITLATNYQRIKTSQELTEFRNAVDLELTDTTMIESRKHYD
jgi:hypothetical protein